MALDPRVFMWHNALVPPLINIPILLDQSYTLLSSLSLNYFLKGLIDNTVVWGPRAKIWMWRGIQFNPIARSHCSAWHRTVPSFLLCWLRQPGRSPAGIDDMDMIPPLPHYVSTLQFPWDVTRWALGANYEDEIQWFWKLWGGVLPICFILWKSPSVIQPYSYRSLPVVGGLAYSFEVPRPGSVGPSQHHQTGHPWVKLI